MYVQSVKMMFAFLINYLETRKPLIRLEIHKAAASDILYITGLISTSPYTHTRTKKKSNPIVSTAHIFRICGRNSRR